MAEPRMGQTFYSALGVDADADRETIRRAYRSHVKETHPDVNDSPDAVERFRRLTTARDVLLDEKERRRYDRLGHAAYVRQHVQDAAWTETVDQASGRTAEPQRSTPAENADPTETTVSGQRTASRRGSARTQATTRGAGTRSRTDGSYGNADWQTASEAYRRTPMDLGTGQSSPLGSTVEAARKLGPWLLVYLALLVSAVATAWFFYATSRYFEVSVPVLLSGAALVVAVTFLALLHMLLELYS